MLGITAIEKFSFVFFFFCFLFIKMRWIFLIFIHFKLTVNNNKRDFYSACLPHTVGMESTLQ